MRQTKNIQAPPTEVSISDWQKDDFDENVSVWIG